MLLVRKLPETKTHLELDAFKLNYLIKGYAKQFRNSQLINGGLVMGGATCFVYVFAALAPFIAINIMHMDVVEYGIANLLPPIGLVLGSLVSARLATLDKPMFVIKMGILISFIGSLLMFIFVSIHCSALLA